MADHITNTFYMVDLLDEISSLKAELLQAQKDLGLVQRSRSRILADNERLKKSISELSRLGNIGAIIPDKEVRGD